MKKILFIIAGEGFQSREYGEPKRILEAAGIKVLTASDRPEKALGKDGEYTVEVVQNFQEIRVTLLTKQADALISNAKIKGDTISFFLGKGFGRNKTGMFFKGKVTGNTISGNVQVDINPFYSHLATEEDVSIIGNHGWTAVRGK